MNWGNGVQNFITELEDHQAMTQRLVVCADAIEASAQQLIAILRQGGKVFLCGNGGSAADCQHIAAELVVQYQKNRLPIAAIALTTDTSILTAHSNDFGFETVYARQIEALATEKDCLIAISTSGRSKNIIKAVEAAKSKDMLVIGLTGADGGELSQLVDYSINVPSQVTARIQEAHILIGHWWCGVIEESLSVK